MARPRTGHIEVVDDTTIIHLANGRGLAYADAADAERLDTHGWCLLVTESGKTYASNTTIGLMHRVVLDLPPRLPHVDHIDGDGLNNRRANLRVTTAFGNMRNTGLKSTNTSGFKGVSRETRTGKFVAFIWTDTRKRRLGTFDTAEDAARAYDAAALLYHGQFARTNASLGLL